MTNDAWILVMLCELENFNLLFDKVKTENLGMSSLVYKTFIKNSVQQFYVVKDVIEWDA